ncbi:AraC family transcriptional regulator [Mesopusillimonas faecipullorum]|uniref:AraC family transcriptional regulator n=1 Tax=Mesopusillimonas faecipullorum TaxID=2755040 RepID=UPI001D01C9EC|nr:AraC family transcriptional regulator [Mesopusillimonas faecipullorum]
MARPLPLRRNVSIFILENLSVQSLAKLDVSKLYDNLIFQSESAYEVRTRLSGVLSEHDLALGQGAVNTALFECRLNDISIMKLTYGAEVAVKAAPFDGFSLIQTPLRGGFDVDTGCGRHSFAPGDVAILSPRSDIGIHWQQNSEQVIVKIPHHLLRRHNNCETSSCSTAGFQAPAFKLEPGLTSLWCSLVQQAIDLSNGYGNSRLSREWLDHFERSLVLFLLTHQDGQEPVIDCDACPAQPINPPSRAAIAPLERMESYIHQRLCAPISLVDLANAAGLSPRSLNVLCHRYHGVSPMVLLRNIRLDEVRRKLQSRPDANVTTIALDHGFGHLGRFSAYYRERFGELPRDTSAARSYRACA